MDQHNASNRLSPLEHVIWSEKQRTGSTLEVALALCLEEHSVKQRLRAIVDKLRGGRRQSHAGSPVDDDLVGVA